MCRHLAYLGPPVALHDLLFGAPHALAGQAREPRHQHPPEYNGDGFGVGWYPTGKKSEPERHLSLDSIWENDAFAARATGIRSDAVMAAARAASPGATLGVTGNAPFASKGWLFSLNGRVDGFYDGVGDELRAGLSRHWHGTFDGDADSEVLFAMALDHIDRGASPGRALAAVVAQIRSRSAGPLNLLLSDGQCVAATAVGNSLFALPRGRDVTIASEPLDDDELWQRVPDGSLVEADPHSFTMAPLEVRT
jgi:gamma-glutamyl hercynylcysteine S-oxide hydrolase